MQFMENQNKVQKQNGHQLGCQPIYTYPQNAYAPNNSKCYDIFEQPNYQSVQDSTCLFIDFIFKSWCVPVFLQVIPLQCLQAIEHGRLHL